MKTKKLLVYLFSLTMTACTSLSSLEVDPELSPVNTPETDTDTPTTDSNSSTDTSQEVFTNTETSPSKPIKSRLCSIHINEYHSYPGELIDFIGEEFYDWVYGEESKPDSDLADDCPYSHCNIIACLQHFNISEEKFNELYYTSWYYFYQYNPKIMYNGTPAEIQNLFLDDKTGKEPQEFIERSKIRSAKSYLREELTETEADENVIEKYQQLPLTTWTLPELLREAQISRNVFEEFLNEHPKFSEAFDLDIIYEEVNTPNTDIPTEPLLDRCIAVVEHEKKYLSGE